MTNLELVRFGYGYDSTLGKLFVTETSGRRFLCYTLEDERREKKVKGETCIPKGSYVLALYRHGKRFHERYKKRWPEIHKGMIEVAAVPNFTAVLIHPGNTDDDTDGCILVGTGAMVSDGEFRLVDSVKAYLKVYPQIANLLEGGERVALHITEL